MEFKKTHIIIILILILISFSISFIYYDSLPDKIPSHWNINGEVDGYSSKNISVFFIPIIEIVLAIIFIIIPIIEPKKKNIKEFIKYYNLFAIILIAFFAYLHFLMMLIANGAQIDFIQFFAPAIGILFYFVGTMIKHAKQNYLIGIKTPWTLANEKVWNKTHTLGGQLFQLSGIIGIFGIILPKSAFWLIIIPLVLTIITIIIYSYLEYQKVNKK